MSSRKEASKMTNVLTNVEESFERYNYGNKTENNYYTENIFLKVLYVYLRGKMILKSEASKKILKEYTQKEKGKVLIKGTRLTYKDIAKIYELKEDAQIQDFMNEYPSLEKEEQVVAGLLLYIKKDCTIKRLLFRI